MFEVFENAKELKTIFDTLWTTVHCEKEYFQFNCFKSGGTISESKSDVSYLKKVSVPGFVPLTFQSEVRSLIHYTTKSWLHMWVCLVYYKGIISTVVFFPSKDGCCYYGGIGRGARQGGGVSRGISRGIGIN